MAKEELDITDIEELVMGDEDEGHDASDFSGGAPAAAPPAEPASDVRTGATRQPKPQPVAPAPQTAIMEPPVAPPINRSEPLTTFGLPASLVTESKADILQYLKRNGIEHNDRKTMVYSDVERDAFEEYQLRVDKRHWVTKSHFVAALRLYQQGFPVSRPEKFDLNSATVTQKTW